MTENQKRLKIPFDKVGDYDPFYKGFAEHKVWVSEYHKDKCIFKGNTPFQATLKYAGFERGRSALNILWVDEKNEVLYRSGMHLLDASLKGNTIVGSCIEGVFCFKRQGTSILLCLCDE